MNTITSERSQKSTIRRRYEALFNAPVLAMCNAPAASVVKVAMSRGFIDNVVHRWRQLAREASATATPGMAEFVPAPLKAVATADDRVDLRRGATTVAIAWPAAAIGELAAFARELLR